MQDAQHNDNRYNSTQHDTQRMFSIITQDAKYCYAECRICSIIILSPVMLNVARLSVVMLSVVAPVLDDLLSESREY